MPINGAQSSGRTGLMLTLAVLAGCAHQTQTRDWSQYKGSGAEHFQKEELEFPEVPDPFEPFNRSADAFNRFMLSYLLDPLATGWRALTPDSFRASLVRAAQNLGYPVRLVNNLLQGKLRPAGTETARFLTNTTLGLAGLFDPAGSLWGLRPFEEDMGQTFAHWGWRNSTFLTLHFWGPSTVRDALGTLGDMALDPTTYFFLAGPAKSFIAGADRVEQVAGTAPVRDAAPVVESHERLRAALGFEAFERGVDHALGERQQVVRAGRPLLDLDSLRAGAGAGCAASRADVGLDRQSRVQAHGLLFVAVVLEVHAVAQHVVDAQSHGARAQALAAVLEAVHARDPLVVLLEHRRLARLEGLARCVQELVDLHGLVHRDHEARHARV